MIKFFTITFFLLLFSLNLYAQNKTAYDRKRDELTIQFLKKLGVSQTDLNRGKEMGELEALFKFGDIMQRINTVEGIIAFEQYEKALKNAEKLKTDVDFKREKEKKEAEDNKKRLIAEAQEAERIKYEFAQEERYKIEREKEIEENKKYHYEKSEYSNIKKEIEQKFDNWYERGEFEKNTIYKERLKDIDFVFDSICFKIIELEISNKKYGSNHSISLQKYDNENELFPIQIIYGEDVILDTIKIGFDEAEKFKKYYSIEFLYTQKYWGFNDYNFYPSEINISFNKINRVKKINFPDSIKVDEIVYTTKNMEFNNYHGGKLQYIHDNYVIKSKKRSDIREEIAKKIKEENEKKENEKRKQAKYLQYLNSAKKYLSENDNKNSLNFFKLANELVYTSEQKNKIDSLEKVIEEINSNYSEIARISELISSSKPKLQVLSEDIQELLEKKNKKAGINFSSVIQSISEKINENTLRIDVSNNMKISKWTTIENDMLIALKRSEEDIKLWSAINEKVVKLIDDKEIKVLKSEENPEILIQKIINNKN